MPDATDFDLEGGSEVRVIASSKPKVNWSFIIFIIIVVTVGVVLVFQKDEGTKTKEENLEKAADAFRYIDEEEAKLGYALPPGTGRIAPHWDFVWSATTELSGTVLEIRKEIGDTVKEGEVVAVVANKEIQKQSKLNEIAIEQAQKRLEYFESKKTGVEHQKFSDAVENAETVRNIIRNKLEMSKPYEGVTVSSVEINQLNEELSLANNSLKQANANLESFNRKTDDEIKEQQKILDSLNHERELILNNIGNLEIKAPADLNVLEIHVQKGQIVPEGGKILTFYDPQQVIVRLSTSYTNFPNFDIGRKAKIFIDADPNNFYPGEVTAIQPLIKQNKNNFEVIIGFTAPDEKILIGCTAQIEFVKEK